MDTIETDKLKNFSAMSDEEKKVFAEGLFAPLNSASDIKDWAALYLGLELPLEITDPESTSSPLDAIWQVYNTFKNNSGDVNPGYILLSSREGMKCQIRGTIGLFEKGFKRIEEVKKGDKVWTGFSWQKVVEVFDEGLKPALKVNLEGGHSSTGTPNHRYWCLRSGHEQWIAGKDLVSDTDLICLNVDTDIKGSTAIDQEKYDIGYFLGILVGDGSLSLMESHNRVVLTTQDSYIKDFFYSFNKKYLEDKSIYNCKLDYKITSKEVVRKLMGWGLKPVRSWEKTIPSFAYSSFDAMKGFIAGVFDTDGCWDKKGDWKLEMTAGPLLDQIQIALTAFGIESKTRHCKKLYGLQKHLVSFLRVGQTEAAKFEKLGIVFKAKKAQKHKISQIPNCKDSLPINQVQDLLSVCKKYSGCRLKNRKYKKPRGDQSLYYENITCDKLQNLCNWMNENYDHYGDSVVSKEDMLVVRRYEKILLNKWKKFTVQDVGEQYFYDLEVEKDHSYWSNGLISHNTVSVSILEVLLLLHFQLDIGHAAAVEDQSAVALGYITGFIMTIQPLLDVRGWLPVSENKRLIKFKTPEGKQPFIKIVICNPKGMNSLHSNVLFLDELDLADPAALKEGKFITSYSKGIYGVKVYLSTRKYAFGNMAEAIEKAAERNYKILRWNILDVTESCPPSRHLPEGPKEDRYVNKSLPLVTITPEDYGFLPESEQKKYDLIKDVHEGCRSCSLLPVCRMRLSEKVPTAVGGFYKPIVSVKQQFLENDPDSGEAQLLCFGPETQILMGNGTCKDIKDIVVGDQVITHTGKIQRVTQLFKRFFSGQVYKVENHSWKHFSPTIVTSEHPYFVNGREFKSVRDLKTAVYDKPWFQLVQMGDYISLPSEYESNCPLEIKYVDYVNKEIDEKNGKIRLKGSTGRYVPSIYKLDENFGWMLGYFLAEGYFTKDRRNIINADCHRSAITFCSDVREIEYHERVRAFANSCGLTTSEIKAKDGSGYTLDIYNKTLSELFYSLCGEMSDKKLLHPKLINANLDFLKGVLAGFDAGDGTKRKKPYRELTTCSRDLASQLFLIAMRLKLCPRITKKPTPEIGKQPYLVHHVDPNYQLKQRRTRFKFENEYNQYRIDGLEPTNYEGFVYNIEVDGDHSYIANGAAVHNCWKPGAAGLVYPRFNATPGSGNVASLREAWERLTGEPCKRAFVSEMDLLKELHARKVPIYAGVDWGYTHDAVIVVVAKLDNGEIWVLDCYAAPGLEFADMLNSGLAFREKYWIQKWFCDQAAPSNVKSFNKNGMKSPKFTKDVMGGIESIRSKIVNGAGHRFFRIIDTPSTKKVVTAIQKHRWKLDGQGNPTTEPDDARGIADICDALRYVGQNLFPVKGPQKPEVSWTDVSLGTETKENPTHVQQMKQEIQSRLGDAQTIKISSSLKRGGFHFNF